MADQAAPDEAVQQVTDRVHAHRHPVAVQGEGDVASGPRPPGQRVEDGVLAGCLDAHPGKLPQPRQLCRPLNEADALGARIVADKMFTFALPD
jgi:hypothetical protein